MGIQERKAREREERKTLILQCTKELIVERGVEAVSMQDIARRAELGKATLYLYFPSKEAIFEEIFLEAGGYFTEYVESRLSPGISGLEAIKTLWASYIEIFGESSDVFVLFGIKNYLAPGYPFIVDESDRGKTLLPARLYLMIVHVLERGVADGTLDRSIVPADVARTVIMISGGIVDNIARLPKDMRNSRLIIAEMRQTFEIVLRGLAAPGVDRGLLVLADR
jgi:AcrR family transcriptional regulator